MATKAAGATIYYGNTGGAAATQISRVRGISPPDQSVPAIDTSVLASTAREYTSGLQDNGEAEFEIEYGETIQNTLDGLIGVDKAFKILYADSSYHNWEGFIMSLQVQPLALDQIMTAKIKIKVSGALTFTEV